MWAYAYALRYLTARLATDGVAAASDLDVTLDDATRRIFRAIDGDSIRDAALFPHYVSVICRNVLRSYYGRRRPATEYLDDRPHADPSLRHDGPTVTTFDRDVARATLATAFAALPPAVGAVAELRLIRRLPYPEVAEQTGHSIPTARAYVSKALKKLRASPTLRALYREWFGGVESGDGHHGKDGANDPVEVRTRSDASLPVDPPADG